MGYTYPDKAYNPYKKESCLFLFLIIYKTPNNAWDIVAT